MARETVSVGRKKRKKAKKHGPPFLAVLVHGDHLTPESAKSKDITPGGNWDQVPVTLLTKDDHNQEAARPEPLFSNSMLPNLK